MTTFYNLILIILHTVGMLVIAVINTSKMVFFYDWYW